MEQAVPASECHGANKLIEIAARREGLDAALLAAEVAAGRAVVVRSRKHAIEPMAVGGGAAVKVNANIGTSPDLSDIAHELAKLETAVAAGADTVMDLSVGGDVDAVRREIVAASPVPVGTVPLYQVALDARRSGRSFVEMPAEAFIDGVWRHLEDGVDFITVHCGINRANLDRLRAHRRICGVVSRGGSMVVEWMVRNNAENPLYERYDELLKLARETGAVLSLGDGMRPGAVADATDEAQIAELLTIGELVKRARAAGVGVIVEGPGHVPLDQVEVNVKIEKALCGGAPFYVLGPLVTDVACGYDHISAAIGGALAAYWGADFLCYVTPSEHLGLPDIEEVRQGVIAARIAAHAADLARRRPAAVAWDYRMSQARAALDWDEMIKHSIDPGRAREFFDRARSGTDGACTMCGEFCAIKRCKETLDG